MGNVGLLFVVTMVGVGHHGHLECRAHALEGRASAPNKLSHILVDFLMSLWALKSSTDIFTNSIFRINTKLFFTVLMYLETYN